MPVRAWFEGWLVYRQLTGGDRLGRGTATRSRRTERIEPRIRNADRVAKSVCPYCAVGCGQNVYASDEKVIQIEGDPDSPVSRGRLCPKGSASLQLTTGSGREYGVRYRPPFGKDWEDLATVIHVDPRFTRTSAVADVHVPIRAGADIAFVGGIINYVLRNEKYFRDYVLAYTNAATIVTEDFAGTEDLDGVFSGLDREYRLYEMDTWRYQGAAVHAAAGERDEPAARPPLTPAELRQVRRAGRGEAQGSAGAGVHPAPDTDETLTHRRCVFQILKRHFSRYTPELVAEVAGVPEDTFRRVCELVTENSGRDRTTAFVYSLGWTQHTVGVQYIRTAAILQALLGNIGRPGGGILALRGHASIQG